MMKKSMFRHIRRKLAAWIAPPPEPQFRKISAAINVYTVDERVVRGGLPCSICGRPSRLTMPAKPSSERVLPVCDDCARWQTLIQGTSVPCASYIEPLDELVWLDEDVSYVSEPLHAGMDILKHPVTAAVVGFRVRGVRAMLAAAAGGLSIL
jgi:hypothetical protein